MKTKMMIGIIVILMVVIIFPVFLMKDISNLNSEDIACAKRDADMILQNPIERLLVLKTVVAKKEGDTFFVNAHTIAGIKYATIELVCDENSTIERW
jgi:hypothetical protein